jgi:CHASE3 domain sensor protein
MRLLLGYSIPLVLLATVALITAVVMYRLLDALERERHTHEVLARASSLKENLNGMQAAKRSHHLLGEERFHQTYERDREEFRRNLDRLRQLVADNPDQLRRLQVVDEQAAQWDRLAEEDFHLFAQQADGPRQALADLVARSHLAENQELVDRARKRSTG